MQYLIITIIFTLKFYKVNIEIRKGLIEIFTIDILMYNFFEGIRMYKNQSC